MVVWFAGIVCSLCPVVLGVLRDFDISTSCFFVLVCSSSLVTSSNVPAEDIVYGSEFVLNRVLLNAVLESADLPINL